MLGAGQRLRPPTSTASFQATAGSILVHGLDHLPFLTQVFLKPDQMVQILRRDLPTASTAVVGGDATTASSIPLTTRNNTQQVNCLVGEGVRLPWRLFLKDHEVLQRQYRRFKRHQSANKNNNERNTSQSNSSEIGYKNDLSSSDRRDDSTGKRSSKTAMMMKNHGDDGDLNDDDDYEVTTSNSKVRKPEQNFGSLMLTAVRNFGSHQPLSEGVTPADNSRSKKIVSKAVSFVELPRRIEGGEGPERTEDHRSSMKSLPPHLLLLDDNEEAREEEEEEKRISTTAGMLKDVEGITAILDSILCDLNERREVVDRQIAAIEDKGWNKFAYIS